MHSKEKKNRRAAIAAVAGGALLIGWSTMGLATAAYAWGSSVGAAPWACEDSRFSGSSWYPAASESRASTYGAGSCFSSYPLSAALRYATSGYTIAATCTSGGGGGSGNCQYISTVGYSPHSAYKGGRHGLGTTFFLT